MDWTHQIHLIGDKMVRKSHLLSEYQRNSVLVFTPELLFRGLRDETGWREKGDNATSKTFSSG